MSRRTELHRRRTRRHKLAKLRSQYSRAETEAERAAALEKMSKIAPWLALELQAQAQAVAREQNMAGPPAAAVAKKKSTRGGARGAPPRPGESETEHQSPRECA
jgi:hypothetical protein